MKYSTTDLPPALVALNEENHGTALSASQADLNQSRDSTESDRPPFFDAINTNEALLLYSAVRNLSPAHSLEVGFCCGGSGLAILKALQDNGAGGKHHVCDPFQSTYANGAGLANVARSGLSGLLDFHEVFPEEFIPTLPRLQFAFVDASHLFDLSLLEFSLIDKKLDLGGVIAFHDLWMPSLQKLVRYILGNHHYKLHAIPNTDWQIPARVSLLRKVSAAMLSNLPKSDRIFSQEILRPWGALGIGNLVFLEKTKNDDRDWRHFRNF